MDIRFVRVAGGRGGDVAKQALAWSAPAVRSLLFTVMLVAAPLLWMAYNAKQFGDPLDFLRGPYSAKAIEERTTPPGAWHHPGWHSMRVAALYFLKAAELGAVSLCVSPTRF